MRERTADDPWQDLDLVKRAFALAIEVHREDLRKDTTIPYLSHLWSVAALVLEHGGDDKQVAAALLHDAVEDGGGVAMLDTIRQLDEEVADLVLHLSDGVVDTTKNQAKLDWKTRKVGYLQSLEGTDARVLLVSACDKLHNARCILADHRVLGPKVWDRFSHDDPTGHAWYYDSLARAFSGRVPHPLYDELRRTIDALFDRLRTGEAPELDVAIEHRRVDAGQQA